MKLKAEQLRTDKRSKQYYENGQENTLHQEHLKKLQAKIALGKVVDNSIAPTECTKACCFDTPNRNLFYK